VIKFTPYIPGAGKVHPKLWTAAFFHDDLILRFDLFLLPIFGLFLLLDLFGNSLPTGQTPGFNHEIKPVFFAVRISSHSPFLVIFSFFHKIAPSVALLGFICLDTSWAGPQNERTGCI